MRADMAGRNEGAREERTAERRAAMAASTLRAAGLPATDVTVVDLSQTGIRIATDAALAKGDEISIGLGGVGARRAYVAWYRDGEYGCAFEQPLDAGEMRQAFTNASVVRLGAAAELAAAPQTAGPDLRQLYGASAIWQLPPDAVLAILIYLALFGYGLWRLMAL